MVSSVPRSLVECIFFYFKVCSIILRRFQNGRAVMLPKTHLGRSFLLLTTSFGDDCFSIACSRPSLRKALLSNVSFLLLQESLRNSLKQFQARVLFEKVISSFDGPLLDIYSCGTFSNSVTSTSTAFAALTEVASVGSVNNFFSMSRFWHPNAFERMNILFV